MLYKIFKRIMDIIISFIGLILLMPVFIIIMITIKLDSKGPIFFKQKRVGKNKKEFNIYKFRTMYVEAPSEVPTHQLINRKNWITKTGSFLRKTSLDELPQLFNILIGKMSIIGPRPVLASEKELIEERDKFGANDIYPGLTGYAQVNGRDKLSVFERAELDGYYVKHMGMWLDLKIFFKTIKVVFNTNDVI